MKKTYIKPEMDMEVVQLEGMIAASGLSIAADDTKANAVLGMEGKDRNDGDWGGLW